MKACQGCKEHAATVYAVFHFPEHGQVSYAGGAYLCPVCVDSLRDSGAVVAERERVTA